MSKQSMINIPINGIPVTIWFDQPVNNGWEKSIRLESMVPNLGVSPQQASDIVNLILDLWVFSEEDLQLARGCSCGVSHIN